MLRSDDPREASLSASSTGFPDWVMALTPSITQRASKSSTWP